MTEEQKRRLEQKLWDIANTLRGKMDADEFRDYILGFIFYKYLSEKMHAYANRILAEDGVEYLDVHEGTDEGEAILEAVREDSVEQLGYFLRPSELFSEIAKRGNAKGRVISEQDFEDAKRRLLSGAGRPKAVAAAAYQGLPAVDDHLEWMIRPFRRYADFTGRSTRREFWMFLLFTNLVTAGLALVAIIDAGSYDEGGPVAKLAVVLIALGILGSLLPYIAAQIRRMHDQGRSGWYVALNLIPYIGPVIVLGFMLVRGQDAENQYGPDPLAE